MRLLLSFNAKSVSVLDNSKLTAAWPCRYDREITAYIPCNKAWIKDRALQHLSKVAEQESYQ